MSNPSQKLITAVNRNKQRNEDFKGIDCTAAIFPTGIDLAGVQLRYAVFARAGLRQACFDGANLRHVDFRGANLIGASFADADVGKAHFGGALVQGASLFLARNLDTATGIDRMHLFFPQADLEFIVSEERPGVLFDGNNLTMPEHHSPWKLLEGYRIVSVIDGNDKRTLIGSVRSREELAEMGAEVYPDTALFDDAGYQLEQGFVGRTSSPFSSAVAVAGAQATDSLSRPSPGKAGAPNKPSDKPSDKSSDKPSGKSPDKQPDKKVETANRSDLDLLNEFLTSNLK